MNRVRTGLTGLGLVLVFTLIASAAFMPEPDVKTTKEAAEPLAQLGVAPGADKSAPPLIVPAPDAPFQQHYDLRPNPPKQYSNGDLLFPEQEGAVEHPIGTPGRQPAAAESATPRTV